MSLFGLILAGGKSSRMGFDKAQLNFHGTDQVSWLNGLLNSNCERVFVSGSPKKITGEFNFIEDFYDQGGPMNGILSAFKQHPDKAWMIVPVDMPNIDQHVIEFLISHRDSSKYATHFINHSETIEPLPAILESQSYSLLLNRFLNNDESLYSFLKENYSNQVRVVNDSWLANKNYPDQNEILFN